MPKYFSKTFVFAFFILLSLFFFENDINSKIIILVSALSLIDINFKYLKILVKNHYPLFILVILLVFSLLYSNNKSLGLSKILQWSIVPAALVIFGGKPKIPFKVFSIGYVLLVLSATLYSHLSVVIKFISNQETEYRNFFNMNYSYKSLANTINLHGTYYSIYILVAIIFLLNYIKSKDKGWGKKLLCLFILSYLSLFIVQLSSRSSIFTLYVVIIFNIIKYAIDNNKKMISLVFLIAFHLVGFFTISKVGVTMYRFKHLLGFEYYTGYNVNDSDHKIKMWDAAINSNNNLLFGNGIGDVQNALNNSYKNNDLEKPLKNNYNSHNQYIEFYIAAGLLGLFSFLFLLFHYFKSYIINKNFIGVQFLMVVLIMSFTECLLNRHNGLVFIVLGLFFFSSYNKISATTS